jgi:2-dehydropantoate 2-reductase
MTGIAVIGPGAIGGTVTAWLARDPDNPLTVCVGTPLDRLPIDSPRGTLTAVPPVLTRPAEATPVGWVLIATKAYDVAAAAAWLPESIGLATRVAILQNGVDHIERFAPHLAAAAIVPAVVDLPAERLSPGHVRQRGDGRLTFPLVSMGATSRGCFRRPA